jgi:hypothetical protein
MKALLATLLAFGLAACDPKKPSEPRPPVPKVDFTHERSMS